MSDLMDEAAARFRQDNPEPQGHTFFDPVDAALAVPRGVLDAAKGVYGLADTLTFDALPDWDKNPLGESDSTVGGFIEGATDFMAGFLPVAGVLSRAGKFAKLGKFALENPITASLARGTIASGVAGFTVMDGHEQRLSNLMQDSSLANPITEFLAAKDDDPALLARLKSALENSVLGLAGDALVTGVGQGVQALKRGRLARAQALAAGATAEEAAAIGNSAAVEAAHGVKPIEVLDPAQLDQSLNPALDTSTPEGVHAAVGDAPPPRQGPVEPPPGPEDALRAAGRTTPEQDAALEAMRGPAQPEDIITGFKRNLVRSMGVTDDKVDEFVKRLKDRVSSAAEFDAQGFPGATGVNPKALSSVERFAQGLKAEYMNLRYFVGGMEEQQAVRTMEDLFHSTIVEDVAAMRSVGHAETAAEVVQTFKEIAHYTGGDVNSGLFHNQMSQTSGKIIGDLGGIKVHGVMVKTLMEMKYMQVAELAAESSTGATEEIRNLALAKLKIAARLARDYHAQVRGLGRSAGRVVDALRIQLTQPSELFSPEAMKTLFDDVGGLDELRTWARKVHESSKTNANAVAELLRAPLGERVLNATQEFWMNALLSGLKTTTVNVLGPTLNSLYIPMERMLGASLIKGAARMTGSNADAVAQSGVLRSILSQASHLFDSVGESWGAVKRMGLSGEVTLDMRAGVRDRAGRAISDEALQVSSTLQKIGFDPKTATVGGQAVDWMGKWINLPTAILSSGDAFTKNLNYRSMAKGYFHEEGQKLKLFGQDLQEHIAKRMSDLIYKDQAFTTQTVFRRGWDKALEDMPNASYADKTKYALDYLRKTWQTVEKGGVDGDALSGLSQRALEYARDVTFTTPAERGQVAFTLQKLVFQHPTFRFVLPFINTPMNLVKWTGQRLDFYGVARLQLAKTFPEVDGIGLKSLENTRRRYIQEMMSPDPAKRAAAVGRIASGASVATFVYHLASQGDITGRGPKDPDQRKQLLDSGWLPYAFKIGGTYVSYARLDPLASMIGTAADIADYSKYAHVDDQGKIQTLAWGMTYALANNFTNKTYLAGLAQFIDAVQNPERNLPNYVRSFGAGFLPNIAGQAVPVFGDENMRDVRSLMDAWVNKTPGLSDTLPPQRNVLGEPIHRIHALGSDAIGRWVDWMNPIAATSVGDDLIKNEMVGLKHAFTTPKPEVNGMVLSSVQMPSGQTAYDRWQELHSEVKVGGMTLRDALRRTIKSERYQRLSDETTADFESPRVAELNSIIREYRQRAWKQLLNESPDIKRYMTDHATTQRLLRSGRDTRIIPGASR